MNLFFKNMFFLLAAISFCTAAGAQTTQDDPQFIIGKLDNGLSYYICSNPDSPGFADFYIAHNVGALQEEDNQNGLAHFLEHMAFNGTKHYPDKRMLEFLARDGVRFGYNVNAYTSRTETVYNISSVPLVRESFIDSVLMVLHDWSCDISCEQEALDAERGVISEEWRRRDEPRFRMTEKQNALIYKGAKHPTRSVLGTLEVINGFKREEILDFYHKWYRPDLQAIIIAGDFDAKEMEQKVIVMFSDIPAQDNPAQKEMCTIPPLTDTLFENMTDPQTKYYTLKVIHRQPFPPREERSTEEYIKDLFIRQIVTAVADERFSHAAKEDGSPVKSAVLVTSKVSDDFYSSMFTISPKGENLLEETLAFYTREMKRLLQHGISEDEFETARFKTYKKYRLNSDIQEVANKELVNICKEHFLRGFPCVMPQRMAEIQRAVLSSVTFEEASAYIDKMFRDSEKIYAYSINSEKEGMLPDEGRMKEIIAQAEKEETPPAYLTYSSTELATGCTPGKILKYSGKRIKGRYVKECEEWTLGNGATVYYIPSPKVKSDKHIAMTISFGTGYPAFPQDKIGESRIASAYMDRYSGFRDSDRAALRNSPECLGVSITSGIGYRTAYLNMTADSLHAENGFKMAYLQLTEPYFSDERTLERFKEENIANLKKEDSDSKKFSKEISLIKYGGHKWLLDIDTNDVKAVDMDFIGDIYRRCFNDFSNMTVYIASDLGREYIKGLVERYIASLHSGYSGPKARYCPVVPIYKGRQVLEGTFPVKTVPKSEVKYRFCYRLRPSAGNLAAIEVLDYIMTDRYIKQIREERGGTYHVDFSSSFFFSENICESTVEFRTRPEMPEVLIGDVEEGLRSLCEDGPSGEEMDEALKYLSKHLREKDVAAENSLSGKVSECTDYISEGVGVGNDYDKILENMDASHIRKIAKKVMKGNRLISIFNEN